MKLKKIILNGISLFVLAIFIALSINTLLQPSTQPLTESFISVDDIPAYSGEAYVTLNNNKPFFDTKVLSAQSYEYYSDLDLLGRCGIVYACIGQDIMPTQDRGAIGQIKPSGWHTVKYDIIDDLYLYNRCHLIGYQLTGENANTKNLITGTRQMNVEGMLPFENIVSNYIKATNNHVLYRVTPIFDGTNLVANGVLIEAYSIEDNGAGICFNVFIYNVQDGIEINYANGDSTLIEQYTDSESESQSNTQTEIESEAETESQSESQLSTPSGTYAVNSKNGKIHIVGTCPATEEGDNAMTEPIYFNTYEEALSYSQNIEPNLDKRNCGNCWK